MAVNNYGFPRQAIPDSDKTEEWCIENLRAITRFLGGSNSSSDNFLNNRNKDIANYAMYNGHINVKDYEYITDQYGLPFPAQMANFPLAQTKIDLLVNEDAERPLDKKVTSINKEAALRKEKFKVSLIANKLLTQKWYTKYGEKINLFHLWKIDRKSFFNPYKFICFDGSKFIILVHQFC